MSSPLSEVAPAVAKLLPAGEVPERVGDQLSVVDLDTSEDVRARAEDEVGAGVDRGVCERSGVAAVLAHCYLGADGGV